MKLANEEFEVWKDGEPSSTVVDSIIGTRREVKWLFHLNELKAEIIFEVVHPLMMELNPQGRIVGLSFEWLNFTEDEKHARVKVLSKQDSVVEVLRTEFLVSYSSHTVKSLDKVIVYNEKRSAVGSFDLFECTPRR